MSTFFFLLRHFNDIDHIAPVMWKLLQKKHKVLAVLENPFYRIETDVCLKYLKSFPGFRACYYYQLKTPVPKIEIADFLQKGITENILLTVFKVFNRVFYHGSWARKVMEDLKPEACMFDYGGIDGAIRGKLFQASKEMNIPVLCLPHGLNTLMDYELKESLNGTRKVPDFVRRNEFDAYIFQSVFHRDKSINWGLNPDICCVMGSARFYPEWQELYLSLMPDFKSKNYSTDKIKVVFMLQQWGYKANKEETLALIDKLSTNENIYLVVKEHTRKGGRLSGTYKAGFKHARNVEFTMKFPSSALIHWSDVVINMGSSIGIDAILQGKYLINPVYLHGNRTIYEETGACAIARNHEQVVEEIINYQRNTTRPGGDYKGNTRELIDMVVYGSKGSHNVLESYCDLIVNKAVKVSDKIIAEAINE